jgi:hypothetical protein
MAPKSNNKIQEIFLSLIIEATRVEGKLFYSEGDQS